MGGWLRGVGVQRDSPPPPAFMRNRLKRSLTKQLHRTINTYAWIWGYLFKLPIPNREFILAVSAVAVTLLLFPPLSFEHPAEFILWRLFIFPNLGAGDRARRFLGILLAWNTEGYQECDGKLFQMSKNWNYIPNSLKCFSVMFHNMKGQLIPQAMFSLIRWRITKKVY